MGKFALKLKDNRTLIEALRAIIIRNPGKASFQDIVFQTSIEGVALSSSTSSRTIMGVYKLLPTSFSSFTVPDEPLTFKVDARDLVPVAKKITQTDGHDIWLRYQGGPELIISCGAFLQQCLRIMDTKIPVYEVDAELDALNLDVDEILAQVRIDSGSLDIALKQFMLIEADADVEIEFKDTIPKVVMRGFARQSKANYIDIELEEQPNVMQMLKYKEDAIFRQQRKNIMYIIGRLSYKTKIKLSITEHGSLLAQLSQPTTDWNFLMASLE